MALNIIRVKSLEENLERPMWKWKMWQNYHLIISFFPFGLDNHLALIYIEISYFCYTGGSTENLQSHFSKLLGDTGLRTLNSFTGTCLCPGACCYVLLNWDLRTSSLEIPTEILKQIRCREGEPPRSWWYAAFSAVLLQAESCGCCHLLRQRVTVSGRDV